MLHDQHNDWLLKPEKIPVESMMSKYGENTLNNYKFQTVRLKSLRQT